MADILFDEPARRQRRQRALSRDPRPFLAERIIDEWLERLEPVSRRFGRVLVSGVPAALHPRLASVGELVRFADGIDALADEEATSLDLILVMGELDARDELPLLLRVIASRLAPDGLLAGAMPGGQSLPALRAALHAADREGGAFAARSHPRIEPGALAGLLAEAGLADAVVDIDRLTLRYRSFERLIGDLRDHGATNVLLARPRHGLGKSRREAARAAFAAQGDGTATTERIDMLHFAGWSRPDKNRA
ncbi:SAM-dependent methyltransferase [Sphingomonas glaciei]|uniref:SAM-dependent methyltransferase n=1 Tax=Sphingomonas glaciei TaxID=2938948 RepID=A0ABY5MWF4_9SPHN|nr:SAM-dependent methyltransferase [Sphingomonas glaciei]UUR08785.1 SAM-dependent methyltransferase [Sphingomonas glaciei]